MKIVFMGTPEFAVASLQAIHARFPVAAVVTVPDAPQGRGLRLQPCAVKKAAVELGIDPILQPASLRDAEFLSVLKEIQPDIIAVVAFRILPKEAYSLAKLGAFNIHASLLPKYRGAAPINWAIINGEKQTGVTSFLLDDSVDTGAMLGQKTIDIPSGMTAGELHDALAPLGAALAVETCAMLASGKVLPQSQNHGEATKAPKIFRQDCRIDWRQNAVFVRNFIHGLSPYPGAWTLTPDGKTLKILRCRLADELQRAELLRENVGTGEYLLANGALCVMCQEEALEIVELQPEGKRAMKAGDFIRGFRGAARGAFGGGEIE